VGHDALALTILGRWRETANDRRNVRGVHVLIDPGRVPPDRVPSFLAAVKAGGAAVVQVRIKDGSTRSALAYLTLVLQQARPELTVIVNDRLDWALAAEADGVHLGQEDLPVDVARRIAPHLIIGASVGSVDEWRAVQPHRPDYLGVGSVFATPSKSDAGTPIGIEGLRRIRDMVPLDLPVIAIGGITGDNVGAVWQAGVDGVAVIHAVADAPDPEGAVRRLARSSTG